MKLNQYKEHLHPAEQMELPYIIEIEAGLVTGSDEVIKNILREVYQRFNTKLKPK